MTRFVVALALVAFLVNLPLVHGTLTGVDVSAVVVAITLVADVGLAGAALLVWRHRGRPVGLGGDGEER